MVAAASRLPPRIACSTGLRYSAILGETGRSTGELVGSVIGSVVGSVVGGLKQPCIFGCSLRLGLWRCIALISDSMLVEPPALPVFSSSSSTTIGLSKVYQKKSWILVRNALGRYTLTVTNLLDRLELVVFSRCWKFLREGGRLKTGLGCDRIRANSRFAQIIIGIIYLIDYDSVFLELLNIPIGTGTCELTCTPGLLQPVHTFPTLVQTCTVCCALRGISNVSGARRCYRLGLRKVY